MGRLDTVVDGSLQLRTAMGAFLAILLTSFKGQRAKRLLLRVNGVDQTDAQGLICLGCSGQRETAGCHAHADQTGQTLGAAEARRDA